MHLIWRTQTALITSEVTSVARGPVWAAGEETCYGDVQGVCDWILCLRSGANAVSWEKFPYAGVSWHVMQMHRQVGRGYDHGCLICCPSSLPKQMPPPQEASCP